MKYLWLLALIALVYWLGQRPKENYCGCAA
jgi:hypothetical protein